MFVLASPDEQSISFTAADCLTLGKYQQRVPWTESNVSAEDQAQLRSIRSRLKILAGRVEQESSIDLPLTPRVSVLNPNGKTPTDYWSCIVPASAPIRLSPFK